MKLCVSSTGTDLESQVDPRFGRCSAFIIADSETMDFEAIPNEAANAMGGAGISAAQSVASKGVEAVITGNVGPNAFSALSAAGLKVYTGASGTVKEAIEMFKSGNLDTTDKATSAMHSGMGGGPGMGGGGGPGGGPGGGMGGGRMGSGFGMGMGGGYRPGFMGNFPMYPTRDRREEINYLRNYENMLKYQIQQIQERIDQLKQGQDKR